MFINTSFSFLVRILKISKLYQTAKVKKELIVYTLIMGLTMIMAFLQNIFYAKILSPKLMGYYAMVINIASYGTLLQLGLLSGLTRELPYAMGKGNVEYSARLVGEVSVILSILIAFVLLIYSLIVGNLYFTDNNIQKAFLLSGALAASVVYYQIILVRLRSERKTILFPLILLSERTIALVVGSVACYYLLFSGPIYVFVITNIIFFIYITKWRLKPATYGLLKRKEIIYLIKIGLPMMIAGLLDTLRITMDRIFLIKITSPYELGIYQFGALPLSLGIGLSGIINQYYGPKILFEYGKIGGLRNVFRKSMMLSLILVGILLVSWPLAMIVIKYIIIHWLPKYERSIPIISIFFVSTVFVASNLVGITISAANRPMLIWFSSAITLIFCFIGCFIVTKYSKGIEWYAYISASGSILSFLLVGGFSFYCSREHSHTALSENSR